jgi:hypothetical protein
MGPRVVINLLAGVCLMLSSYCTNARATRDVEVAQSDSMSESLRQQLKEQSGVQTRKRGSSPPQEAQSFGDNERSEQEKVTRIQRLLDEIGQLRNAAPGTVTVKPDPDHTLKLEHYLPKVQNNFSVHGTSPFANDIAAFARDTAVNPGALVFTTPADVEYRVRHDPGLVEEVIGIKSRGEVGARAFRSSNEPVVLEVATADLVAQQTPGPQRNPPVNVRVGNESRSIKSGETAQIGNMLVLVETSLNRSADGKYLEGPAYTVELRVWSAP